MTSDSTLNALLACSYFDKKFKSEAEFLVPERLSKVMTDLAVVVRDREPAFRAYLAAVWQRYHEPYVRMIN